METVTAPERHQHGWGYELWIVNKAEYCGKILVFRKGTRGSLHFHLNKDETFYLQSGSIEIRRNDKTTAEMSKTLMKPGDVLHIPRGQTHQIVAHEYSELFEFSTTHDEDDSYRITKGD